MAVIDTCNHLYATVKFSGTSGGPWEGEMWQYGLRIGVHQTQKSLDAGVVQLDNFSIQDAAVTRSIADWDVEQAWSGVTVGAASVTDADQDEIVTALVDPFRPASANLSSYYEVESVKIYGVHLAPDGRWLSGAPNSWFPKVQMKGGSGTMLPADSAAVVSFYTATRGVKGRGRAYVGGLAVASIAGTGRFSQTFLDFIGTGFAQTISDIRGINSVAPYRYCPSIWHRPGDKAGLEDGTRASVIQRVEVNDIVDTQRRRDKQAVVNWNRYDIP